MIRVTPLTKRQREVYNYLVGFTRDHGYAPKLDEIGEAMGLSSLATVHKHLANLADRGYIKRDWNRARSLTILVGPGCCPTCGRALEKIVDEAKVTAEIGRKSDTMGSVVDALTATTPTTTEVP